MYNQSDVIVLGEPLYVPGLIDGHNVEAASYDMQTMAIKVFTTPFGVYLIFVGLSYLFSRLPTSRVVRPPSNRSHTSVPYKCGIATFPSISEYITLSYTMWLYGI